MVVQGRPSAGVGTHSTPSSLFPGDKTVSFKDFLGVLTDSHRLAQCLSEWQGWRGRREPAWGSSSLPSCVDTRPGKEQPGLWPAAFADPIL